MLSRKRFGPLADRFVLDHPTRPLRSRLMLSWVGRSGSLLADSFSRLSECLCLDTARGRWLLFEYHRKDVRSATLGNAGMDRLGVSRQDQEDQVGLHSRLAANRWDRTV